MIFKLWWLLKYQNAYYFSHCAGRHFRRKLMSQYIDSFQKNGLMWGFRNLFQKMFKILSPFWENNIFNIIGVFAIFVLLHGHFCTNLREILAPGLKWILPATLFLKKIILINPSCVNDPTILAQKQQKKWLFWQSWLLGPKIPPRGAGPAWNICSTPVPAILNYKNSNGSAGGAKNSQNWVFLKVQI